MGIFNNYENDIMSAILLVSTYCIKVIDIEKARELGIEFNDQDVKENTLRGVYYTSDNDGIDFIDAKIEDIESAWILLGFKDGEFVTERRLSEKYLENVKTRKKIKKY